MVVTDFVMAYSSLVREKKTLRLRDLMFTATLYLGHLLFEVNAKHLSSVLKTSEFSRGRSTSENSEVFNSRDEIFLVFTPKNVNFLFILYFL